MNALQISTVVILFYGLLSCVASLQDGDVRLADDNSTRGRLEVYDNGTWTSVCYNYKDVDTQVAMGRIVCRQLGFFDVFNVGNVTTFELPNGTKVQELANVRCRQFARDPNNAPQHIYRCFFHGTGGCNHGDDMAILCNKNPREDFPYDTMVDFLHDDPVEESLSEGIAQVYVNGQWGPVCNMRKEDADVFCRQLSFTNAVSVTHLNDPTINDAYLDTFHCGSTNEACLRDCFNYPDEDAAITCLSGHSYVTCEFRKDLVDELFGQFGTRETCTAKRKGGFSNGAAAGAAMGILLAITAIAIAAGLVYFFLFHKGRTGSFSPNIPQRTKYDAI